MTYAGRILVAAPAFHGSWMSAVRRAWPDEPDWPRLAGLSARRTCQCCSVPHLLESPRGTPSFPTGPCASCACRPARRTLLLAAWATGDAHWTGAPGEWKSSYECDGDPCALLHRRARLRLSFFFPFSSSLPAALYGSHPSSTTKRVCPSNVNELPAAVLQYLDSDSTSA